MRTRYVVVAVVLALVVAACGSDEEGAEAGENSGSSGEFTSIEVGYVPYADDAAIFLAVEKGIFREHGLDVTLTPAQAPTAVVASMVSGQQQFGFVTTPVLINANAQGTPLQCVSTVDGRQSDDPENDGTALVAAPGSGIQSVEDLAGKRVAVVQLASLNSLAVQALALRAGIEPESVELIQLPFPQMPDALRQGRVSAAVIVSPFLQGALANGAQTIVHPNVELWGDGTVVCFAATTRYIEENGDVVEAFHDAMVEATRYAGEHQEEAKATLPEYLEITPEQAQNQILSTTFDPSLNVDSIEETIGLMKDLGAVEDDISAEDMVWSGAQ